MTPLKFPFQNEIILTDDNVILRPLVEEDIDELSYFVLHEPELFSYALQPMHSENDLRDYVRTALEHRKKNTEYPFAVIDRKTGKLAGSTRFYLINTSHSWLAIGYTWIGKDFQGTGLNRSMKRLMLSYTLLELGFHRVEFRVDKENVKSIRALNAIGAVKEGELRNHMYRADGSRRNTILFSIIKEEFKDLQN